MSTSWSAGVVRARALAQRRVGAGAARDLAGCPDLAAAVTRLAATSYRDDVRAGMGLVEAQHGVSASLLWNLRVLAGWLPRGGSGLVRVLAAGYEVANVDTHLARLGGTEAVGLFELGALGTAWTQVAPTTSLTGVRDVLGASAWRLREAATRRQVSLGMRLAWAEGVATRVRAASPWARAAAALWVLRETFLEGRAPTPGSTRSAVRLLGPAYVGAVVQGAEVGALRLLLPADTRWSLEGIEDPTDLWRAEGAWWLRVERDGFALLRGSSFDEQPVVGSVAVLAADAWRVRAALEVAARGASPEPLEAFDAMA